MRASTTKTAPEFRSAVRGGARGVLPLGIALLLAGAAAARAEGPAPTPTPTPAPSEHAIPHLGNTEIVVTAPRMDIPLNQNPAATTVVEGEALATLPRTIGADLDGQRFDEIQRPNLGDAGDETTILTDQVVHQRDVGVYILDRLELSRGWSVMAAVRHDSVSNTLDDNLATPGLDLSGRKTFSKATGRLGVAWNPAPDFGAHVSWAQGFLPPATEELANNPDCFEGFNAHLIPATSHGEEVGVRGSLAGMVTYDVVVFRLLTATTRCASTTPPTSTPGCPTRRSTRRPWTPSTGSRRPS